MASFGNILWFLAIGGLFYFMMRRGGGCCGGHNHDGHSHQGDGADPGEHNSGENAILLEALNAKDPVCGTQVDEKAAFSSTYMGQPFRFCSERCQKLFDMNPNKYIGASQATDQHSC